MYSVPYNTVFKLSSTKSGNISIKLTLLLWKENIANPINIIEQIIPKEFGMPLIGTETASPAKAESSCRRIGTGGGGVAMLRFKDAQVIYIAIDATSTTFMYIS